MIGKGERERGRDPRGEREEEGEKTGRQMIRMSVSKEQAIDLHRDEEDVEEGGKT